MNRLKSLLGNSRPVNDSTSIVDEKLGISTAEAVIDVRVVNVVCPCLCKRWTV